MIVNRADLAARANVEALKARPGAPELSASATRATVLAWLQWNDPNGSYTDAARKADSDFRDEGPLTLEEAWREIYNVL